MTQTKFDPEHWLETTFRGIKDYVESNVNTRIYQVVMEFPAPLMDATILPLRKTIIHFELDDSPEMPLGFGDNNMVDNYDSVTQTVNPQEARIHHLNFDVGIWASDASGGTTSRMRARQILSGLFGGAQAFDRLKTATDGGDGFIEILRFSGGSFAIDTVNDQRLYRMIGCELELRVWGRTPKLDEGGPAIEEIFQDPGLTILG